MMTKPSDEPTSPEPPSSRVSTRRWPVLAIAATIALAAAACSTGDGATSTSDATPSDTTAPPTTSTTAAPSAYDFGAVSELVSELVAERGLEGAGLVVVERDDGVVHEEYWGPFDAERVSLVASASKMLSAGVLMRLDDEGLLDIDAPVADVVDWGSGNPAVTPAQLLSNSSGLVGIFPDPVYLPYICQFLPEPSLQGCGATILTSTEDDADVIPPDSEFRYGGGQWQVAGAVAEAASGRSWAELIEDTYVGACGLDPADLGYSNYISEIGNGIDYPPEFTGDPSILPTTDNPNIEAGAYATPTVFAEVLLMHLRDGECSDGQQVLSPEAIERSVSDRVATVYGGDAAPGLGYGLGWWIDRQDGLAYSVGAYGATPALNLDEGYGFYLVLEANDATWQAIFEPLSDAVEDAVFAARG